MVSNLRLAHLFADLSHESFVQLTTKLGVVPILPFFLPTGLVLQLHVVDDIIQRTPRAQILVVLRAILTTIQFRLTLCCNGLSVGVALVTEAHRRHVRIHMLAVATQITPPQIRPQCILSDGLLARLAH